MRIAGLLEALVTADQLRVTAGDDVALTEQRAPRCLAGLRVADREAARKGPRVVEIFMFVDGGFLRGAARGSCQHECQPKRTEAG
ncbi:hypothetical protein D3C86_1872270 [compost metagenome]